MNIRNIVNGILREAFKFPFIQKLFVINVLIVILIGFLSCTYKNLKEDQDEDIMKAKTIEEVLKEYTEKLMSIPGVVGIAQGLCAEKSCIRLHVIKRTPELEQKIPKEISGYPIDIVETGEIKALPENEK